VIDPEDARTIALVCGPCRHVFAFCELPIEAHLVAALTRKAACPQCGSRDLFVYTMADLTEAER
jgi:hypothetical protein